MENRVTTSTIEEAARRLPAVIVRTPTLPARWLTEAYGTQVMLKCENLQLAGSFKIRGAYTKVSRLSPYERRRGIITYSSGNHAQAVAMAAKFFDIKATVVMPETAPQVKLDRTKELGARVIQEGTTSIERREKAEKLASKEKLTMIPPFDDLDIIAGQGTVGRELVHDWPDVQAVLVPVGGGGLIAGIAAWVKEAIPNCRVIGVETEAAASMKISLARGEPTTIKPGTSIADGLMPVRPGDLTFAHARDLVDDIVLVKDDAMREAVALLWAHSKLVVEFSGAAAVAALLQGSFDPTGLRTAAVLTGGNIDPDVAAKLLRADIARPAVASMKRQAEEKAAAEAAEAAAEAEGKPAEEASTPTEASSDGAKKSGSQKAAGKPAAKKATKKAAGSKKPARKSSPKKAAKKSPSKKAAKKSPSKKAAKKSPSKKAAKKSSSKKAAKKSSSKKAAKKSSSKKSAKKSAKKSSSKKASSKSGKK